MAPIIWCHLFFEYSYVKIPNTPKKLPFTPIKNSRKKDWYHIIKM